MFSGDPIYSYMANTLKHEDNDPRNESGYAIALMSSCESPPRVILAKQAQTETSKSTHTTHPSADSSYDAWSDRLRYEGGGPVTLPA